MAIFEAGVEHRFGVPVVPASDYGQLICKRCGLLYLNCELPEDYLTRLYSQENVEWQKQYTSESTTVWNGGSAQDEIERFSEVAGHIEKFTKGKIARWLDFGCQTGELGEVCIKKYRVAMSGVEVSSDYASVAEARWNSAGSVKASLKPFREAGDRFDVISSLETLEHLAQPWKTVSEFHSIVDEGGLLLITVPSTHYFYLKYLVFRAFRTLVNPSLVRNRHKNTGRSIYGLCHTHPYNFSPKSMRLMLEAGGFEVLYTGGVGWAKNFWWAKHIARLVSFLTGGLVQFHPSILVVARKFA